MDGFKMIKQGAEAKLYQGVYLGKSVIVKERFQKKYRHESLDNFLTKERIKAEARAIVRCKSCDIKTPTIYLVDFKRRIIIMENFEYSITAKDFIESMSASLDLLLRFSYEVGKLLGSMHQNNIIHGDLTSSNILVVNKNNVADFSNLELLQLVLIDFGLSRFDTSSEDKGVDLYVLERALISTHSVADRLFPEIINGYRQSYKSGAKEVLLKYEEVRARGRKRTMVG